MGQRVFVSDAARKILAARDDKKCTCDAMPSLASFRRSMRAAVRDGVPFSKALHRAVRDQMGAGGPSTGGSPEKTPGPGYEGIQTSAEFHPNAVGNISPYSRASTTQQSLNMGQTWGTEEELPTEQTNAHGFPLGAADKRVVYTQIVKPNRSTMDAAKASIQTGHVAPPGRLPATNFASAKSLTPSAPDRWLSTYRHVLYFLSCL
jgi:hypothetical protein